MANRSLARCAPAGTFAYAFQGAGSLVQKLTLPNASYITNAYDSVARLTGTYLDNSSNTVLDKSEYLYNSGNVGKMHGVSVGR